MSITNNNPPVENRTLSTKPVAAPAGLCAEPSECRHAQAFSAQIVELLKDARHRIANLSRSSRPFDDPLDGPVLRRLDSAIAVFNGEDNG